ncbi:MAG: glycosyltransferase family 87 protein [Terriglobales bacterium]
MTWAKFGKRKEWFTAVFLLAMTIGNVVSAVGLASQLRNGYQNFTIFYAAARMVRGGQSRILYDLPAQYRVQQEFAPNVQVRQAALPYNHPPFEAFLFVPFTLLSYVPAYLLWSFLNAVLVFASLWLLRRQFVEIGRLPLVFLALAAIGFPPVANGIIQGQDSSLLLFLVVVALTAVASGNDAAAGAALGAGLFKFNFILPLAFLLAVKRPRLLLGFAPVAALLGGLSLAMLGWRGCVGYVQFLFHLEKTGAGGAIIGADMPNLRGILTSLAGPHGAFLMPITIACSALVIAIALWQMWPSDSVRFVFALATATAILVSYHTLSYDLGLLLPVLLLLFAAPESESRRASQADMLLLVALYLAPLFESFWPHLNQIGWPMLILFWFWWKLPRREMLPGTR